MLVVALGGLLVAGLGSATNRWRVLPVRSSSMAPAIPGGAAVVATPVAARDLHRGDVIVYHAPTPSRPLVVHRVTKVLRAGRHPVVRTKGDAARRADPWKARLRGSTVWRVTSVIPLLGTVLAAFSAAWLRLALALLALALVAAWLALLVRDGRRAAGAARAHPSATVVATTLAVAVILLTSPAFAGGFSATALTTSGSFTADTLTAPGASSLSCVWNSATNVTLNFSAGSSWADTAEVQRSANWAAFADLAALGSVTGTTYSDSPASPSGTVYAYQLQGRKGTAPWTASASINGGACQLGISSIARPTTAGATLKTAYGVARDSSGNVYIADNGGNNVRRVDVNGRIHTFAGSSAGTAGKTGDGGSATTALLNSPEGVAVDSSGNVYIADTGNNRVRKVTVTTSCLDNSAASDTCTINAFAGTGTAGNTGDGGAATSATFSAPTGVAVDSAGNTYIVDKPNNRVRKVDTSGNISNFAGSAAGTSGSSGDGGAATSAFLNLPQKVAVDSTGANVYIADTGNNRVRKVNGGTISAFAGTGTVSNTGDGGAATSATMNSPTGLAVDSSGNVYIADRDNHNVRKVSGGTITHVAGSSTLNYDGYGLPAATSSLRYPNGLALDSAGNVYIADYGVDHRVRELTAADSPPLLITFAGNGTAGTGGDAGPAATAELVGPYHLAVDSSKNVYIADYNDNRIRKYIAATGHVATFAGTGANAFAGDGTSNLLTSVKFSNPSGIALDSSGNVYIADTGNNRVREIVASTSVINTVAGCCATAGFTGDGGAATAAKLSSPRAVVVDSAGNVYLSDQGNQRVREFTVGGTISTVAGNGTAGYTGDGTPATSYELSSPGGLAVDSSGNVYIADVNNNRVRKLAGTTISTVAGTGTCGAADGAVASATICAPQGVAVDGSTFYIADYTNNKVRKVSGGSVSTVVGTGTAGDAGDYGPALGAQLNGPFGVTETSGGNLYVSDNGGYVRMVPGPV